MRLCVRVTDSEPHTQRHISDSVDAAVDGGVTDVDQVTHDGHHGGIDHTWRRHPRPRLSSHVQPVYVSSSNLFIIKHPTCLRLSSNIQPLYVYHPTCLSSHIQPVYVYHPTCLCLSSNLFIIKHPTCLSSNIKHGVCESPPPTGK